VLASIDIGTNSILLLIAEQRGQELVPIYQEARVARLGETVGNTKLLTDDAQQRAFDIISDYLKICTEYAVRDIKACGTAALRNARNSKVFVDRLANDLGLTVDIISDKQEANLSFQANAASFGRDIVVMDIGGGSTEFITENDAISLGLGVVELTESFLHADPPTDNEVAALRAHVHTHLMRELDRRYCRDSVPTMVAAAGTPTTLAAMRDAIDPYDPERVHGSKLDLGDIEKLIDRIHRATLDERRMMPGLQRGREDVILAGAILLHEAMKLLGFDETIISDRGVRWGLLLEETEVRSKKYDALSYFIPRTSYFGKVKLRTTLTNHKHQP
jgi:exopolyphosphatase/guanosine-5'-triphosphate,3'-diphosphate pyrophosphatase